MDKESSPRSTANAGTGRRLTLRRKLFYTSICILFAMCLAEIGVRIRAWWRYGSISEITFDSIYIDDPILHMRVLRPGLEYRGTQTHIKINSLGFRGDEISIQKPQNTIRIACVGASTTYCAEASNNDTTWPAQLQKLLRAKYPSANIQVINAGGSGYLVDDSLKNLRFRVLPLEPDMVIFYEVHNDLVVDTREVALGRGIIDAQTGRKSGAIHFLSQHSLLVLLIDKNIEFLVGKHTTTNGKLTEIPRDLPARFVARLQEMHDLLSERQVTLVLSRFLVRFRRNQSEDEQRANSEAAFAFMPWMTTDSLVDTFDLYNDAVEGFARSQGIPFVDDRESVPGDGKHYVDHVHFSDVGCEAMAARFARFMDQEELIEPLVAKVAAR